MNRLLGANLKRVLKSRPFIGSAIIVAAIAIFTFITNYQDYTKYGGMPYYDGALFAIAGLGIFPLAVIVSFFIGTDYSDGTIRNKLVVGSSRTEIYLANLITSTVIGWIYIVLWNVLFMIPSEIFMERITPMPELLLVFAACFVTMAAFSALLSFISMSIVKKTGATVACIFFCLFMFIAGTLIKSMLDQDEYYSPVFSIDENDEIEIVGDLEPNPNYIPEGSTKRAVYEFMLDFLPGGQIFQISEVDSTNAVKMIGYDFGWYVVVSLIGVLVFRRKDLK